MTGEVWGVRYCAPLPVPAEGPRGLSRAAMLSATFWGRGALLTIGFFGGDRTVRERVRDLAMTWLDRTGANLFFQFWTADGVDPAAATIRIGFDPAAGSWSWVGNQALRIAPHQPTMNLGWMTADLDEASARAVVLHEFGHAIGLIHEHLHPFTQIDWNRERVAADLAASQGWDEATIRANMFDVPPADQVFATAPDSASIMMYAIPPEWLLSGEPVGWNTDLSAEDIRLIQAAYGTKSGWRPGS